MHSTECHILFVLRILQTLQRTSAKPLQVFLLSIVWSTLPNTTQKCIQRYGFHVLCCLKVVILHSDLKELDGLANLWIDLTYGFSSDQSDHQITKQ